MQLAQEQLRVAQESLLNRQRELNERLATLGRLRQQRREVANRGREMIRRGFQSLDELESAERVEEDEINRSVAEASESALALQSGGAFGVVDWGSMMEGADVDFSAWLSGGNPEVPVDSSSGF